MTRGPPAIAFAAGRAISGVFRGMALICLVLVGCFVPLRWTPRLCSAMLWVLGIEVNSPPGTTVSSPVLVFPHPTPFDHLTLMAALDRPLRFVALARHLRGPARFLARRLGCIVLPETPGGRAAIICAAAAETGRSPLAIAPDGGRPGCPYHLGAFLAVGEKHEQRSLPAARAVGDRPVPPYRGPLGPPPPIRRRHDHVGRVHLDRVPRDGKPPRPFRGRVLQRSPHDIVLRLVGRRPGALVARGVRYGGIGGLRATGRQRGLACYRGARAGSSRVHVPVTGGGSVDWKQPWSLHATSCDLASRHPM